MVEPAAIITQVPRKPNIHNISVSKPECEESLYKYIILRWVMVGICVNDDDDDWFISI